jgi:hypothetical protein
MTHAIEKIVWQEVGGLLEAIIVLSGVERIRLEALS